MSFHINVDTDVIDSRKGFPYRTYGWWHAEVRLGHNYRREYDSFDHKYSVL